MVVAFFGHRCGDYRSYAVKTADLLIKLAESYGADTFYVGGYGDFDIFAARAAYRLKQVKPAAKTVLVASYFPAGASELNLPYYYDSILYPDIGAVSGKMAIERRNIWMADAADIIVSGVYREYGVAFNACRYAEEKNKKIFYIKNL